MFFIKIEYICVSKLYLEMFMLYILLKMFFEVVELIIYKN